MTDQARESLAGRAALVTGGTSGIGLACARALLDLGAHVTVTYRSDTKAADALSAELPAGRFLAVRSDATVEADVAAAVAAAEERAPVDILVNNVGGVIRRIPALGLDPAGWRQVMALNLDSTYLFTRAVLPGMVERGRGSIVNISAQAGFDGGAGNGSIPYGVAKAGIEAMTKGLGRELAASGVRVNALRVGLVDTPLHDATEFDPAYGKKEDFFGRVSGLTPMKRAATPAEIADCVVFLASDRAAYVTGAVLQTTGGM